MYARGAREMEMRQERGRDRGGRERGGERARESKRIYLYWLWPGEGTWVFLGCTPHPQQALV